MSLRTIQATARCSRKVTWRTAASIAMATPVSSLRKARRAWSSTCSGRRTSTVLRCEVEQRALFNGGFTDSLQETYRACVIGNASKPGRWIVQFLDESHGNGRAALMDAYMWGYSNQLLPGGKFVYLIETLGAAIPLIVRECLDRAQSVYARSSPSWKVQQVATLPVVGCLRSGRRLCFLSLGRRSEAEWRTCLIWSPVPIWPCRGSWTSR